MVVPLAVGAKVRWRRFDLHDQRYAVARLTLAMAMSARRPPVSGSSVRLENPHDWRSRRRMLVHWLGSRLVRAAALVGAAKRPAREGIKTSGAGGL